LKETIPIALYAYHNTIHTATGCTPHHFLDGWQPRDLCVPLTLLPVSEHPDLDAGLEERARQMRSAHLGAWLRLASLVVLRGT
jgi:hypothetical protein